MLNYNRQWNAVPREIKKICKDLLIALAQSSVKTPETNDQVEAMNKKILKALKKKVDDAKSVWLEEVLEIV